MAVSLQQLADEATEYQRKGEVDKAIVAYKKLLTREPGLPDSWYNLGLMQRQAEQFDAALDSYQQALDLGARGPEQIYLNRAVIYSEDLYRHDIAKSQLKAALDANPDYVPAMLNLAELLEDEGQTKDAEALYRKALELEPGNVLALARLASLRRVSDVSDSIVGLLQESLKRTELSDFDRADLSFALGQVLDSTGKFDEAFKVYGEANTASRRALSDDFEPYDPMEREALIDRIIENFPAPADDAVKNTGNPPIFICGMIRTGSTLTERILSVHSQVTAGGEMNILPALIRKNLQPYPEIVQKKRTYDFQKLQKQYAKATGRLFPEATLLTDKRPDNLLHMGLIKRIFPNAKFVHTRRNRIDTCLSIWFAHLDPSMSFALNLEDAFHWCEQFDRLEKHWRSIFPNDIHEFDYDAMVANPETNIRKLLEFCGLEWEEQCLEPHLGKGMVRTGSASQIREPLYTRSSGRWQNYASQIGDLVEKLEA